MTTPSEKVSRSATDATLTDDEAEGIREAMAEIDRGEGVPAETAFAEIREDLEALARLEQAREKHRRVG